MKFDFVIGNPPYQEESKTESKVNGQNPRTNIFHYFQLQADALITEASVLIYPGGRWMHQSGKGVEKFGKNLINDVKLAKIEFYPDAKDIFENHAELPDGITIVTKLNKKVTPGFNYVYIKNGKSTEVFAENPGDSLIQLNPTDVSISTKLKEFVQSNHLSYLHDAILPRSLFGIESNFVSLNPTLVRPCDKDSIIDPTKEIYLFTNDKAGKAGRAKWYIADRDVIQRNTEYIDEWQVVVSSANAGGQKRDNQIEIIGPHAAYGRSRVGLRSFKTKEEAANFLKYANTYFIRYAFLMTDESLTSLAKLVPDLTDYSDRNPLINFKTDIDKQLFSLAKFSQGEIEYVKNTVDNIREK